MSDNSVIQIPYNHDLGPLEKLVAKVKRPGDFFVSGAREMPMPKVEVAEVGVLSFPIPEEQVKRIISKAVRAPYGRGEATILDTSVRKVWQISPDKIKISGKSWEENFHRILGGVTEGLGCGKAAVAAELYKLLVYDEGGFFVAHRDTEKAPGMFGTLVIVLPAPHRGGDLVVRHAGREVKLDLSSAEVSELSYAAFYADCEHEVRPITAGNRVCLVYNLIQQRGGKGGRKSQEPLTAPVYDKELAEAAVILEKAMREEKAPAKIAWLLEHKYTPAELSFATLKNADAARAQVLLEAAKRAGCAVHLGIVHIGDSGAAEPGYEGYQSRRSRWNRYSDDEEEEADDSSSGDFHIVDVCDSWQHVDDWVDPAGRKVDFGKIPLADGELLPAESLDDEPPDEQSCTEATGNEGASYERSYHRAAVVFWRQDRYAEVLLQVGVRAVLPYLKEPVRAASADSAADEALRQA